MHSNIGLDIERGSGRRRGLRAASLLFVAAPLVHPAALGALGAGPDAAVGLMAADLLILVGSSARASIITRTLPEDEAPAFRSAGFVGLGSHHYVPVEAQQGKSRPLYRRLAYRVGKAKAITATALSEVGPVLPAETELTRPTLCAAHGRADRG